MKNTKKEFQKVISIIRKEYIASFNLSSGYSYPKPMMTNQQMEKHTATVNCGGEWSTLEKTKEMGEIVLNDERFKTFIKNHSATAKLELNQFGTYQVRINY